MKKKISYVLCMVLLISINGCALKDDTTDNHDFDVVSDVNGISETEITKEVTDSAEKRMLLYGDCGGNLGLGWLLYTIPNQEGQDYKIYFFADQNHESNKPFEGMDFDLEQADFIFPDARENNMAIGKFDEMYLYEIFTTESDESARIVIATYETGGRQYYDTRIYTPIKGGYGYVLNEAMTEELNALYSDVEEYPVWQILEMPHD